MTIKIKIHMYKPQITTAPKKNHERSNYIKRFLFCFCNSIVSPYLSVLFIYYITFVFVCAEIKINFDNYSIYGSLQCVCFIRRKCTCSTLYMSIVQPFLLGDIIQNVFFVSFHLIRDLIWVCCLPFRNFIIKYLQLFFFIVFCFRIIDHFLSTVFFCNNLIMNIMFFMDIFSVGKMRVT